MTEGLRQPGHIAPHITIPCDSVPVLFAHSLPKPTIVEGGDERIGKASCVAGFEKEPVPSVLDPGLVCRDSWSYREETGRHRLQE